MTVTTTSIGTYSKQITVSGETSSTNIISAIDAAIVALGWTQYDVTLSTIKVYRCLNADGSTYKYFAYHIDTNKMVIGTTSFESWSTSTHTGTNEVWNANRGWVMGYTMNSCDIIVMASSKWCIMQTYIRGIPSFWSGVLEVQREFPEDTAVAGYPCWIWVNSQLIGSDYDTNIADYTTSGTFRNFSFPRTRVGDTGATAANNTSFITPFDRFGYGPKLTSANTGQGFGLQKAGVTPVVYSWDNTKKIVHTLRPRIGLAETHGRVYGLKATAAQGYSPMNIASVKVDSDMFYSGSGTATDHWLLPTHVLNSRFLLATQTSASTSSAITFTINNTTLSSLPAGVAGTPVMLSTTGVLPTGFSTGVVYYKTGTGTSTGLSSILYGTAITPTGSQSGSHTASIYYGSGQFGSETMMTFPFLVHDHVSTGTYYYVATEGGVYKVDNSSYAITIVAGISDVLIHSIAYDGQFVWAAGETKLWKIDTLSSDAITSVAITGGCGQVYWSGSYVWCGDRTSSTALKFYRVSTSLTVTAVTSIPAVSSTVSVGSICSDLNGYVYCAVAQQYKTAGSISSADTRVIKVTESTAAYSSQCASITSGDAYDTTMISSSGILFDGVSLIVVFIQNGISSPVVEIRKIDPVAMTVSGLIWGGAQATSPSNTYNANAFSARISRFGPGYLVSYPSLSSGTQGIYIAFCTDLVSSASALTTAAPILSVISSTIVYTTYAQFDGNRCFIGANTPNRLYEITNVVRPNLGTSTLGMWMIPK